MHSSTSNEPCVTWSPRSSATPPYKRPLRPKASELESCYGSTLPDLSSIERFVGRGSSRWYSPVWRNTRRQLTLLSQSTWQRRPHSGTLWRIISKIELGRRSWLDLSLGVHWGQDGVTNQDLWKGFSWIAWNSNLREVFTDIKGG